MNESDFELAQKITDMQMEKSIEAARCSQPEAVATGACLYCGEQVKPGFRWCSPECRDDWEMVR